MHELRHQHVRRSAGHLHGCGAGGDIHHRAAEDGGDQQDVPPENPICQARTNFSPLARKYNQQGAKVLDEHLLVDALAETREGNLDKGIEHSQRHGCRHDLHNPNREIICMPNSRRAMRSRRLCIACPGNSRRDDRDAADLGARVPLFKNHKLNEDAHDHLHVKEQHAHRCGHPREGVRLERCEGAAEKHHGRMILQGYPPPSQQLPRSRQVGCYDGNVQNKTESQRATRIPLQQEAVRDNARNA
mmetsp:Transcript_30407/g.87109  ORF Transcript_30407/g.87109 Transcript_30407/m.87109 type:complete len:245 (-) Transcript_30407:335-1069(-)